jgi:3-dehydro-L-gulonate 2-dehydrogenase
MHGTLNRKDDSAMVRVSYEEMYSEFRRVLLKTGFTDTKASLCARLFADASRDGVYSHGLNRFPRFIGYINEGLVDVHAEPEKVEGLGAIERWDGKQGPGNLNAYSSMNRAMELADKYGMGCIALRNTNHWMRAGSYGLQAAEAGYIGICWTNTLPNMPPWGATECRLGNNPIVLSVPIEEGHIILDMAMSMFSYGKLETHALNKKPLPVAGGFDLDGELTRDPQAILDSRRPLPLGYWKGAGLSFLLDIVATVLSGGNSTDDIGKYSAETNVSQVFLAFHLKNFHNSKDIHQKVNAIVDYYHQAKREEGVEKILFPGERSLNVRKNNLEQGIPVEAVYWNQVLQM